MVSLEGILTVTVVLGLANLGLAFLLVTEKRKSAELETNRQGQASVREALKEAREIVAQAKQETSGFTQNYNQQIAQAAQAFADYLKRQEHYIDKTTDDLVKKHQSVLEDVLRETLSEVKNEALQAAQKETERVRQELAQYKKEQTEKINQNALSALEKTLGLVINKRLSLSEHTDLVLEALEQARADRLL